MSEKKTKTEQFTELLSQYETIEEAKKHIPEIAKKLKVAKSLGYKALKRVKKFYEPEAEELPKAEEPIVKIPEISIIEEEEIPTTEYIPPEEEELQYIPPEIEKEIPKPPEEIKPIPPEVEELRPIFLRSIKRGFNIVTDRIAEIPEASLNEEEADDTMTLINLLLLKYTPTALSQYYLEITALTHFGTIIADRILLWRRKPKKEEAEIEGKIREREAKVEPKALTEEEVEEIVEETKIPKSLPHLPLERKRSILGRKE